MTKFIDRKNEALACETIRLYLILILLTSKLILILLTSKLLPLFSEAMIGTSERTIPIWGLYYTVLPTEKLSRLCVLASLLRKYKERDHLIWTQTHLHL